MLPLFLYVLAGFVLLLFICYTALFVQTRALRKRLAVLMQGDEGQSLEQILHQHLQKVESAVQRQETLEQAVGVLQAQVPRCISRAGMVRYNAFADVGGEQSFAIALLDSKGNGMVLTSLYSRSEMRVYAKTIQDGRASHNLSDEEKRAIQEAVSH